MSVVAEDYKVRQRTLALQHANDVRLGMSEVKAELRAGTLSLADALVDRRAGAMSIYQLLTAQRRWGRKRALTVLRRLAIGESKPVRELTARQCGLLVEAAS